MDGVPGSGSPNAAHVRLRPWQALRTTRTLR